MTAVGLAVLPAAAIALSGCTTLPGIHAADCASPPVQKPSYILLACGDGSYYAQGIKYTSYTATSATAIATMFGNDCIPYCAIGHFHQYPATLTFSRVVSNHFTWLVIRYTGSATYGPRIQSRSIA